MDAAVTYLRDMLTALGPLPRGLILHRMTVEDTPFTRYVGRDEHQLDTFIKYTAPGVFYYTADGNIALRVHANSSNGGKMDGQSSGSSATWRSNVQGGAGQKRSMDSDQGTYGKKFKQQQPSKTSSANQAMEQQAADYFKNEIIKFGSANLKWVARQLIQAPAEIKSYMGDQRYNPGKIRPRVLNFLKRHPDLFFVLEDRWIRFNDAESASRLAALPENVVEQVVSHLQNSLAAKGPEGWLKLQQLPPGPEDAEVKAVLEDTELLRSIVVRRGDLFFFSKYSICLLESKKKEPMANELYRAMYQLREDTELTEAD